MIRISQCALCKHLSSERSATNDLICPAFPAGIPEEIQWNQYDHRLPHPDDHGVRYEADDPELDFHKDRPLPPEGETKVQDRPKK
jgi:hypothetical protein